MERGRVVRTCMIKNWFIFSVALLQIAGAVKYLREGNTAVGLSFIGVAFASLVMSTV